MRTPTVEEKEMANVNQAYNGRVQQLELDTYTHMYKYRGRKQLFDIETLKDITVY